MSAGGMATRRETLMFRVGLGVAMVVSKVLWLSSTHHARASLGLPGNATRLLGNGSRRVSSALPLTRGSVSRS